MMAGESANMKRVIADMVRLLLRLTASRTNWTCLHRMKIGYGTHSISKPE